MTALRKLRFMSVLPTARCNFSCPYCYAAKAHSSESLTARQIESAVDYFLSPKRTDVTGHTVTLLGGGEPLCRFDLCARAVSAIERSAAAYRRRVDVVLVTNGSLLDDEICRFLLDHNVRVRFSFEILPDVQARQRGKFEAVDQSLKRFCALGGRPSVRSVITSANVGRLSETVERLARVYPGVGDLWCDIVTSPNEFADVDAVRRFADIFIPSYFKARDLASAHGIRLLNVMERQLTGGGCDARYCPGEFALLPDGTLSICHRLSDAATCRAAEADFGRIGHDGTLTLDVRRLERILARREESAACGDCFLSGVCHGGCLVHNKTYSRPIRDAFCEFRRLFSQQILEMTIPEQRHV